MVAKKSKAKKKTTKKLTHVAIVLDRSGSMQSIHAATVGGLNEQFNALRVGGKQGGHTEVTLIQFDGIVETVFANVTPENLTDWTHEQFQPRGMTAMYDAVWQAITQLKTKEVTDDTGFLVIVISDGEENSSREITQALLSKEIKDLQETGKWTFTFMLANQDIHDVASKLSVPMGNMKAFAANTRGVNLVSAEMSVSYDSYFGLRSAGLTKSDTFQSDGTLPKES